MQCLAIIILALFGASCFGQGFRHNNPGFMVFGRPVSPCTNWLDVTNLPNLWALYVADNVQTNNLGFVTNWIDLGPNGYHVTNQNTTYAPTWSNNWLNGHSVVRFDGINDYLIHSPATSVVDTIEVAYVAILDPVPDSTAFWPSPYNLKYYWFMEPAYKSVYSILYDSDYTLGYSFASNSWAVFNDIYNRNTNLVDYYSNVQMEEYPYIHNTNGYTISSGIDRVLIGCDLPGWGHAGMAVAEMAFFTAPLSNSVRTELFNYWCCKYGISSPSTNVTVPPFTDGLVYWFNPTNIAGNDGNVFTEWLDSSGNGYDIDDGAAWVKNVNINGRISKSVYFDSINSEIHAGGGYQTASPIVLTVQNFEKGSMTGSMNCLFCGNNDVVDSVSKKAIGVFYENGGTRYHYIFGETNTGYYQGYTGALGFSSPNTNWCVFRHLFDSTFPKIFMNGGLATPNPANAVGSLSGFMLGNMPSWSDPPTNSIRWQTNGWVGHIVEVMVYASTYVSNSVRAEEYLMKKYNIPR
jgi:hypothetical protein